MFKRKLHLEAFEGRLVPAAVVKFTEADGDKITVRTNKGTLDQLEAVIGFETGATGVNGFTLNFLATPELAAAFAGTNITITAPLFGPGNELAENVVIRAYAPNNVANIDLGAVTIKGNLSALHAGNEDLATPAVKSITVTTWGPRQGGVAAARSDIRGNINAIVVRQSFNGYIHSADFTGADNFRTLDGTFILSFTTKNLALNLGANNGYMQVQGFGKLVATGTFFGPFNPDDPPAANNGLIETVFIERMNIRSMAFGARIVLFEGIEP